MRALPWTLSYSATVLLALILLADVGFVFLHIIFKLGYLDHWHYSLTQDRSYSELFQYLKEFWIGCLMLVVALRSRALIYVAWALVFIYMLADDSIGLHESLGGWLVSELGIPGAFGLRGQDFGELLFTAMAGGVLFSFLLVTYYRARPASRMITHRLLALVAGIAFFGVVVDMVHIALPWGKTLFGVIEDGGEMLIMSLVLGYAFELVYRCSPDARVAKQAPVPA